MQNRALSNNLTVEEEGHVKEIEKECVEWLEGNQKALVPLTFREMCNGTERAWSTVSNAKGSN